MDSELDQDFIERSDLQRLPILVYMRSHLLARQLWTAGLLGKLSVVLINALYIPVHLILFVSRLPALFIQWCSRKLSSYPQDDIQALRALNDGAKELQAHVEFLMSRC